MDFSTPLIFVILFVFACFSLFLVYKYGIKEKSYEEALAEQRQQTNALLGVKPKPKEKKSKKTAKKSKEKAAHQENETDDSENVEINNKENTQPNKLHVEFKEETEEVLIKDVGQIKPKRVKKVRPILVKKEKSPERVSDIVDPPIVNHFEDNPPKDDFALLRSNSKDDILKEEPVKEKLAKEKIHLTENVPSTKTNKKNIKQNSNNTIIESVPTTTIEKAPEEKTAETVPIVPQTHGVVIGNAGKEKKKKKSEFNTRQQLPAEWDGLINSVRKAELSKNEVQLLIDLLLNKQHEAPTVIEDWSEGKFDPVQKLKKQLTEKEKALAEEQEALIGVQAKLKEIRAEQQTEKIQFQQKIRGLEEMVQNKQIEIQANNNRLQVNTQKIQQLQEELNAEMIKTHKLIEDNAGLHIQMQQYEVSLSQMQETDNIMGKLRSDLEELSAQNQQLRLELQQAIGEKEHQHQHFVIQMSNLEKGLEQQIELTRQATESQQELERNLEISLRQENDWKIEISKLNTAMQKQFEEKRGLELTLDQLTDELRDTNAELAGCNKIITQLKSELQNVQEQISLENGVSEQSKIQEVTILNLNNELSSVKNELVLVRTKLQQTESLYKTEIDTSNKNYNNVQKELEEQKAKNNELRTKNWKVMEALNSAESKIKASTANKKLDIDLNKLTTEIITKEQDSQKQFIQRLFPEIEALKAVTSEDWQAEFGKHITNYVANLKIQQNPPAASQSLEEVNLNLQGQIQHYKKIIDNTEAMLNKVQLHIEEKEINWRNQLAAKEEEIVNLKETRISQLQANVSSLEQQLSQEVSEKQRLLQECQLLNTQKSQPVTKSDPMATIEKLSEEVNRLREQLKVEQTKNGDVTVCLKAQNNFTNSANGPSLIEGTGN